MQVAGDSILKLGAGLRIRNGAVVEKCRISVEKPGCAICRHCARGVL